MLFFKHFRKSAKTLLQATPILLNSGLLKLLKSPELDLNGKQMTYTLIGLLVSKVPTSVKEDLVLLNSFIEDLIKVYNLLIQIISTFFFINYFSGDFPRFKRIY